MEVVARGPTIKDNEIWDTGDRQEDGYMQREGLLFAYKFGYCCAGEKVDGGKSVLCRWIILYIFLIAPVLTWDNMPELILLVLAITVVRVQSGSLADGALLI
jgi:hypothetical protein